MKHRFSVGFLWLTVAAVIQSQIINDGHKDAVADSYIAKIKASKGIYQSWLMFYSFIDCDIDK